MWLCVEVFHSYLTHSKFISFDICVHVPVGYDLARCAIG